MAEQQEKKKTSWGTKILGFIFIAGVFQAISGIIADTNKNNGGPASASPSAAAAPQLSPKEEALRDLKLDFEWGTGGFGSVMLVDFTFNNKGKYAVKDIEVVCRSSANSGTLIDKNKKTVYELVKAGETKKIQRFNMGFLNSQATSTSCVVDDLKIDQ
ncbi:MAG: zinc ribbon domain-containing protein [Proteobacteria bacterium]|nr:zinc ribbon domain-containing protein [Pseudomonadota bacterium]